MAETFYTHALWRVKPGNEQAFIDAWRAMGDAFLAIPGPKSHGTLIQSLTDPTLFYSFGPWESLDQIHAMRANPAAQEAMARARELCEEVETGAFRVAATVRL
jgi:heme-degrading monooxygenase HmoA